MSDGNVKEQSDNYAKEAEENTEEQKLETQIKQFQKKKEELIKKRQIDEEMKRKAEEAKKKMEKEQELNRQKEKERKALEESKKLKDKPKPKEKEKPEAQVDNVYIISDKKKKDMVITLNHQMNEELGSVLKKLQLSITSLTVAFIIFIFLIVGMGIFAFLNIPAIDSWIKDVIIFASGISG